MLSHLAITNFALIDALEIEFADGMTVITGETGAGKSILVDALNLVLGGRGSTECIRTDADKATVQAIFELSNAHNEALRPMLEERGIDCDRQLIVRRIVARNGRNKVFINGCATRLNTLRDIARGLVDISGQHEHYSLLDPHGHADVLDAFAGLSSIKERVASAVAQLRALRREVRSLQQGERERLARIDYLQFQLDEIEAARLSRGEEDAIVEELSVLRNAEKLRQGATDAVYRVTESDGAIADLLAEAIGRLARVASLDRRLSPAMELLESARIQLAEASHELRAYTDDIDGDPGRLSELEDRWQLIDRLKRKHGPSVEAILEHAERMSAEFEALRRAESRIDEANAEMKALQKSVMAQARNLSADRKKAALRLTTIIEEELGHLGMGKCRFQVVFTHRDDEGAATDDPDRAGVASLSDNGIDEIEFLISPNPGEGFKPMAKIASGGELSRIMLAIKSALMMVDPVSTYVFDEVDTGIGGRVAEVVGRKIRDVAKSHQVMCITHLPQIAAFANHHMVVEKAEQNGRTVSVLRRLSERERTLEVARMLGGETLTETTIEHASEMISKAM